MTANGVTSEPVPDVVGIHTNCVFLVCRSYMSVYGYPRIFVLHQRKMCLGVHRTSTFLSCVHCRTASRAITVSGLKSAISFVPAYTVFVDGFGSTSEKTSIFTSFYVVPILHELYRSNRIDHTRVTNDHDTFNVFHFLSTIESSFQRRFLAVI